MEQYYLRIDGEKFYFVVSSINEIVETDIPISSEDYNKLQNEKKYFKLKQTPTGNTLFDYIEEYIQEQGMPELGQDEFNLDIEYRLSKLELGV